LPNAYSFDRSKRMPPAMRTFSDEKSPKKMDRAEVATAGRNGS